MAGNPMLGIGMAQARKNSPAHIEALRHFLLARGYHIADTGDVAGHRMLSALKDWTSGINHRDPSGWNKQHGVPFQKMDMNPNAPHPHQAPKPISGDNASHPDAALARQNKVEHQAGQNTRKAIAAQDKTGGAKNLPKHNVPANSPTGHFHGGNGGGGGGNGIAPEFLNGLLARVNTGKMIPLSLADSAASPFTAQAATFADQISRLPAAKQQALQNLSDWFGQVQKAEKHGAAQDQSLANTGAASMQDATKGIMASLGGSAMAGAGEVGAVGANDANTLTAIGANDASLANELAPIFKLSEANAKNTRSQQYDNQLSDLQDQKGQAQGQADAARAAAVMQILQGNNQTRQTNFSNAAGLYNTLAGLQISGMNAQSQAQSRQIENMFRLSEIQKNQRSGSGNPLDAMTPSQRAAFADNITQGITRVKLSWPDALRAARNSARTAGMNPFGNQVIQSIIGPALANAGITGPGGGFWPAIYKR